MNRSERERLGLMCARLTYGISADRISAGIAEDLRQTFPAAEETYRLMRNLYASERIISFVTGVLSDAAMRNGRTFGFNHVETVGELYSIFTEEDDGACRLVDSFGDVMLAMRDPKWLDFLRVEEEDTTRSFRFDLEAYLEAK